MKCETVWPLLSAYADGEATTEEIAVVEAHVAACTGCARDLVFMRSAAGILRDTPALDPPARVRQAIFAATIERPSWRWRIAGAVRSALRPAAVRYGIAAAGAAVLTLVVLRRTSGPVAVPDAEAFRSHLAASLPLPRLPVRIAPGESARRIVRAAPPAIEKPAASARHTVEIAGGSATPESRTALRSASAPIRRTRTGPLAAVAAKLVTAFKVKLAPATSATVEELPHLADDMPDETTPMTTMDPMASGAGATTTETTPPVAAAVSAAHIQLAADVHPASTNQMVSLADLKHWLRRNNETRMRFAEENIRDRQIRLEVYRSQF